MIYFKLIFTEFENSAETLDNTQSDFNQDRNNQDAKSQGKFGQPKKFRNNYRFVFIL